MAEAFLNHMAGDRFEAKSAGLEPAPLYLPAVEVMEEIGIDISSNMPQSVCDVQKKQYQWMITIGDRARAAEGSGFAGDVKYLHWSLPEPLPTS